MRLDQPTARRVRVQVTEYQGNKAVKGSVRNISVWEATSDEVLEVIQHALTRQCEVDHGV